MIFQEPFKRRIEIILPDAAGDVALAGKTDHRIRQGALSRRRRRIVPDQAENGFARGGVLFPPEFRQFLFDPVVFFLCLRFAFQFFSGDHDPFPVFFRIAALLQDHLDSGAAKHFRRCRICQGVCKNMSRFQRNHSFRIRSSEFSRNRNISDAQGIITCGGASDQSFFLSQPAYQFRESGGKRNHPQFFRRQRNQRSDEQQDKQQFFHGCIPRLRS